MVHAALEVALDTGRDDLVVPFAISALEVRGRVVRIGPAIDTILRRHAYPEPVSALLAEATALTALLGTSMKFDGRFILQAQGDGPVRMAVVDFETPDRLRAYASYDSDALDADWHGPAGALLGSGALAMTVDQGADMARYQGVVPLEGSTLEEAAHLYFQQSEQIPTRIRLASARAYRAGDGADTHWRAGGIMVQHLPTDPLARPADLPPGDVPEGHEVEDRPEDDHWVEAATLLETVESHELIDPEISPGRLLYRLYHERDVSVFEPRAIVEHCRCSRDRVKSIVSGFDPDERAEMVEDGKIVVTCEFCSTRYDFDPGEIEDA